MLTSRHIGLALCVSLCLHGCGKSEDAAKKTPPPTLISVAQATSTTLEIREEAVGSVEGLMDPTIAAEIPGRVIKILASPGTSVKKGDPLVQLDPTDVAIQVQEAKAEVARVSALFANQEKVLERNKVLVEKNFISQNALDDISTQKAALREELAAAKAKLAILENSRAKSTVLAPIDGVVEKQIVSTGDYVKVGDPLMQLIGKRRLRVHLPFPENIAAKIQPGLTVKLTTPTSDVTVLAKVREMKALIGSTNRSVDVTADVTDQPGWQPGASVNGRVILGTRQAIIVPELSLVLRPAGTVVYVVTGDKVEQRIIKPGLRQDGYVEILDGLDSGETVAVDGAGFLTDGAKATIQNDTTQAAKP